MDNTHSALIAARSDASTATRLGLALSPEFRLFAAFFLYSFSLGGIFARLGEIQRGMGAGADWSAIYMRDVFAAAPWVCGLAVAAGAFSQAVMRFFADGLVERFSPVVFVRGLLSVLGCGAALVTLRPTPALALLGLTLMGVGTSGIFPLAMSAAALRIDRPAAVNVAALAQISFVVFLLGPPLLGQVAEHYGARSLYGVCVPFVLLSLLAAGSLDRRASPSLPGNK